MRHFAFALTLLLTLPGQAAERNSTMDDARLSQTIAVTEQGDRLTEVLRRLSKETGVKLSAAAPLGETVVVCRYRGKLSDLMEALAQFFATSSKQAATWVSTGKADSPRYQLSRPREAAAEADQLRFQRECEVRNQMEQAIKDDNPWIKWFGNLPADQRYAVYAGEKLTRTASEMGGRPFLNAVLGQNAEQWADRVSVTFFMSGSSPYSRLFNWSLLEGGPEDPRQELTEGVTIAQICPNLAPEKQQQVWRERYGDTTPQAAQQVRFFPSKEEPRQGLIYRRQVMLRIAERAEVNLIADDYEQMLELGTLSETGSLSDLLNGACRFTLGPPGHPEACHGSFWRRAGDTYLVRSLAWPEEETKPIAAP